MANDILMLIKLDTDTIARLSLIFSVVAVIISIAAVFAVFYFKRAAPKNDLGNLCTSPKSTAGLSKVVGG